MRRLGSLFIAAALLLGASSASAQVATGGTIGVSTQPEGKSESPYLGPGFGGTALAGTVFVETDLGARIRAGGELSLSGNIRGHQTQRQIGGDNVFDSAHHDSILSGGVRVIVVRAKQLEVTAGGGIGVAWRETHRRGGFRPIGSVPTGAFNEQLSSVVLATSAAVDAAVAMTPRLSVVISSRVYWLVDDDRQPDGVVERGVSSQILRIGAGVRVRF